MRRKIPEFSQQQWCFLALLEAFESPITIHLAGYFVPLPPGPLFDLINKSKKLGWLIQKDEETFSLCKQLPATVKDILLKINTPDHVSSIINTAQTLRKDGKIESHLVIRLMGKAGLRKRAVEQILKDAKHNLNIGDQKKAWILFKKSADWLIETLDNYDNMYLFLSTVIQLSNLSFLLTKELTSLERFLNKSHEVAKNMGDRRSHALINLHLGRLYYFSGRRLDAMTALAIGLNEVEQLGDDDILDQSSEFLGLFYFMQGLFKDALPHYERSANLYMKQKEGILINTMAPLFLGYCLAYLGDFHRAVGSLDCHFRIAKQRRDYTLATNLRFALSSLLFLIKKDKEAIFHLNVALRETEKSQNDFAFHLAMPALIFKCMKIDGNASEAYMIMSRSFKIAASTGYTRQFASPWILEFIHEFEQLGFEPIPDFQFQEVKKRAISENNIHLQGVSIRLETQQKLSQKVPKDEIIADLKISENYLEQSGDIVQLSKTLIEKGRIELSIGNKKEGYLQINKAWTALGGYADIYFPEDLQHLIYPNRHGRGPFDNPIEPLDRFIEFTESIFPIYKQGEILSRVVIATNRFFGAERGGLFWFRKGEITPTPELRASCNLSTSYVKTTNFKPNLDLILKAFKQKSPIIKRDIADHSSPSGRSIKAILCLPIEVRGKFRAVLYHDNSYLNDCFDFLDESTLSKMVRHISNQIDRVYEYFQMREDRNCLIGGRELNDEQLEEKGMVYECPMMEDLIRQVDTAARSNANILLLGETGVGKEVIARRIHAESSRYKNSFIIVDATSIPENLFESELFGHEKGAFTGADRQKRGRLELANKGTLFIDEIGELPNSIQVKFLRAIQNREFYRVGGNKIQQSDFRLIAATNRNLAEEVAAGRFRQDLFYRLNVVPFMLPPLRERTEDIMLIAQHFLKKFSQKYNRNGLSLDIESQNILKNYNWPGNVRELENIMERSILLSSSDKLKIDLSSRIQNNLEHPFADLPSLQEMERRYIQYVLNKKEGKLSGPESASEILGLNRATLYSRMKKLGMK